MTDYIFSSGAGCHDLAEGALTDRRRRAQDYLGRKRKASRELDVKIQRLLTGALTFFGLACAMALLVG